MLLKRARIEAYLPDKDVRIYQRLREAIENEFLFTFGGCTVIKNIKGLYLRSGTKPVHDKIALVYADMPIGMDRNSVEIGEYADAIRQATEDALPEESVLIVVSEIYHSLK